MDDRLRTEAEESLNRALRDTGAWDPRESYRRMLRELKLRNEPEYELAVAAFRTSVLQSIADGGADPLAAWLEFGRELAARACPGRDVVVDGTGRAVPYSPPPSWQDLILHLPDDQRAKAVVIGMPPEPTPAQMASVALLAEGNVRVARR